MTTSQRCGGSHGETGRVGGGALMGVDVSRGPAHLVRDCPDGGRTQVSSTLAQSF